MKLLASEVGGRTEKYGKLNSTELYEEWEKFKKKHPEFDEDLP